jgi:hypothetical protein
VALFPTCCYQPQDEIPTTGPLLEGPAGGR